MIAFLHTSAVHVERFEKLVKKYNTTIEIQHFVKEDLLKIALETGSIAKDRFEKTIQNIQEIEQPALLICTCSTYGKLCEQLEQVHRIDQPIVEAIVAKYSKIAVAYTVNSTKEISKELIQRTAARQQKKISIIDADCSHCWTYFEKGDIAKYAWAIAEHLQAIHQDAEVIFLAQASMEGAKKYLQDIGCEVVSSPEFGVKAFLELL